MKILSLFLCLCFLQSAFAQTSSLEPLINEHQYFLTVEWDQKDKQLLEKKNIEFGEKMGKLIASGSVNKSEYIELLEKKIHNADARKRLRTKLALTKGELTTQEIMETAAEFRKDMFNSGAQWLGREEQEMLIAGAILLLVVGLAYWWGSREAKKTQAMIDEINKPYCQKYENDILCKDGEWRTDIRYICTSYVDEWTCTTTNTVNYGYPDYGTGGSVSTTTCG